MIDLSIRMETAEQELRKSLQDIQRTYQLPCYFLEILVDRVHRDIAAGKEQELAVMREGEKNET